MAKFVCVCGNVISESHTDFMRTRAHLIPDQDWEEIADGTEAERREIRLVRRDQAEHALDEARSHWAEAGQPLVDRIDQAVARLDERIAGTRRPPTGDRPGCTTIPTSHAASGNWNASSSASTTPRPPATSTSSTPDTRRSRVVPVVPHRRHPTSVSACSSAEPGIRVAATSGATQPAHGLRPKVRFDAGEFSSRCFNVRRCLRNRSASQWIGRVRRRP
jgi:hypothetical protein